MYTVATDLVSKPAPIKQELAQAEVSYASSDSDSEVDEEKVPSEKGGASLRLAYARSRSSRVCNAARYLAFSIATWRAPGCSAFFRADMSGEGLGAHDSIVENIEVSRRME